jgi:hypothetical protein
MGINYGSRDDRGGGGVVTYDKYGNRSSRSRAPSPDSDDFESYIPQSSSG